MNVIRKLRVKPGRTFKLRSLPTGATPGCSSKEKAEDELPAMLEELRKLQYRLFAENRRSVLVVLQAMDAAGKDGLVRGVFSGLNPQACRVTPFKAPTADELAHDYLWRIHKQVPPRGEIGVFNRSHYEDVLIVRVHNLVDQAVWKARYDQIRAFEKLLGDNGVTILKFYLHIGRKEQKARLMERLENPERNWKFSEADVAERRYWDDYQRAYEEALARCATPEAPWYVIPADRKWYRNWAVAHILLKTMRDMDLKFPAPRADVKALRRQLSKLP
jgi:PPK2 family polyphosphate:nucleotide phosphotransferase